MEVWAPAGIGAARLPPTMLFLGLFLASLMTTLAPLEIAAASTAPVYSSDFPDPMVLRVGDTYYAYSTQTAWETPGTVFPVLRSTDLRSWTYVADAMAGAPAWGRGDWWAPSVLERDGSFYLYYTGLDRSGTHCLAVATSPSPTGPFTDQGPLACGDGAGHGYIDPAPYLDETGAWLYFSVDEPYHSISVLPLTPDLLHAAGPRRELFAVSQDWEHGAGWTTVEGPYMIRRGGTYELFYSGNDWRNDYAEGVATATSPTGPFTKSSENPVLRGGPDLKGPGGASLFTGPDGETWMAYHAWTPAGRSLHIERTCWTGAHVTVGC